MLSLLALPNELLFLTLDHLCPLDHILFASSVTKRSLLRRHRELFPCLLVCRRLHSVAVQLLCLQQDISESDYLADLTASAQRQQQCAHSVRVLDLIGRVCEPSLEQTFFLRTVLSNTQRLRTVVLRNLTLTCEVTQFLGALAGVLDFIGFTWCRLIQLDAEEFERTLASKTKCAAVSDDYCSPVSCLPVSA